MSPDPYFYTWTAQRHAKPQHMTGGRGAHFTTSDGQAWLDLGALSYQANAGHGHPGITAAIIKQAGELCLVAPSTEFAAKRQLAEKLLALAGPSYSKVFLRSAAPRPTRTRSRSRASLRDGINLFRAIAAITAPPQARSRLPAIGDASRPSPGCLA
ncbi:MAG: aminotransferase class III-fold pyridoxal phosphate-dependent enzyme [Myxococcales bacterium]|nr:aminotransferase class III-fold pyridoxal phosphate-dependent enzyme [Myxococcales bacterium]